MVEISDGSIFDLKADAIVCPVNTVGVMGKGLAKEFKFRYPECTGPYMLMCRTYGFAMGEVLIVPVDHRPQKYVIHFPTKKSWSSPSKFSDVQLGLSQFPTVLDEQEIRSIGIPALGCGLGGLAWDQVRAVIEDRFKSWNGHVTLFPPQS